MGLDKDCVERPSLTTRSDKVGALLLFPKGIDAKDPVN